MAIMEENVVSGAELECVFVITEGDLLSIRSIMGLPLSYDLRLPSLVNQIG